MLFAQKYENAHFFVHRIESAGDKGSRFIVISVRAGRRTDGGMLKGFWANRFERRDIS